MNISLLPQYQTTPKQGKPSRKVMRMPTIMHEFAVANQGRVELTPDNLATLEQKGLPSNRLAVAAHALRKFYGLTVRAERNGRMVSAYIIR